MWKLWAKALRDSCAGEWCLRPLGTDMPSEASGDTWIRKRTLQKAGSRAVRHEAEDRGAPREL